VLLVCGAEVSPFNVERLEQKENLAKTSSTTHVKEILNATLLENVNVP
jgi:hypothetical protein